MVWMKSVWTVIVEWSTKAWDAIKKLPGWAVVAFLMIGAVVIHLIKRNALIKRRAAAQQRLSDINVEYMASKVEAETSHSERSKQLREQRDAGRAELDALDQQIDEAAKKGPAALASEWKDYLSRKKK